MSSESETREVTIKLTKADAGILETSLISAEIEIAKQNQHVAHTLKKIRFRINDGWYASKTPLKNIDKKADRAIGFAFAVAILIVVVAVLPQ